MTVFRHRTWKQFLSDKFDGMQVSHSTVQGKLPKLGKDLSNVLVKVEEISDAVEVLQQYNYLYNLKVVGYPQVNESESFQDTANTMSPLILVSGRRRNYTWWHWHRSSRADLFSLKWLQAEVRCKSIVKKQQKLNKSLLKELPYYQMKCSLAITHGQFNNSLNSDQTRCRKATQFIWFEFI